DIRGKEIIFIKIQYALPTETPPTKPLFDQYSTSLIPHIRNMKSSLQTSKSGVPRDPISIHALL
ncbi:MAG TPA: hypothetical protein VFG02_01605, partial [Nitrospirota bacterium]|nr:hypothetical protein [Nitrospirota bacterium]